MGMLLGRVGAIAATAATVTPRVVHLVPGVLAALNPKP